MLLEKLSNTPGLPGQEDAVRDLLRTELSGHVDRVETDSLGNLFMIKNPAAAGPRVMLAAHMDEVGLMVSAIDEEGFLKFRPMGGIDPRVLVAKPVRVGAEGLPGVIGGPPVHLQKPEERNRILAFDQLRIDIGAGSRAEAEKLVQPGDPVCFATRYGELGQGLVRGKAFDDRAGCTVLAEVLRERFNFPLYGVFTVQEEVGLRGAQTAAYRAEPDIALVLEGTTCADIPGVEEHGHATTVGAGPAISLMDRTSIAHPALVEEFVRLAGEHRIPWQYRRTTMGGNDAGRIHLSHGGVPTATVSVPCRYIHSPVSVLSLADLRSAVQLVVKFLRSIEGGFRP